MYFTKRLQILIGLFLLVVVYFLFLWQYSDTPVKPTYKRNLASPDPNLIESQLKSSSPNSKIKKMPEFVYLVQTDNCLPSKLQHDDFLGNSSSCRCDVLVLSFKEECKENHLMHVQYFFSTNTSWTEGRNFLYQRIKTRKHQYLYYIFMDDDIELSLHQNYTPAFMKSMAPLRTFEKYLVHHEPAVGVANYQGHDKAEDVFQKSKDLCKNWSNRTSMPTYLTTVFFDPCFNAFHRDAIDHIFPYPTEYDKTSWWHSGRHVPAAVEIIFRGHSVMFTPVVINNPVHRPYPRGDDDLRKIWSSVVTWLRKGVPREFQNETWIQNFVDDPADFLAKTPAMCLELPSHYPIKPYSHFQSNASDIRKI